MFAFIFVYGPAKFSVNGSEPIKRFEPDSENGFDYLKATPVIEAGSEGLLEVGIYGTCGEGDAPPCQGLDETQERIDYDIVTAADKDPLPSIINVDAQKVEPDVWERSVRIRGSFEGVTDADLGLALTSRSAA